MGAVIGVMPTSLAVWRLLGDQEIVFSCQFFRFLFWDGVLETHRNKT